MNTVVLGALMKNNPEIPYGKLAVVCAGLVRRCLGPIRVSLIADQEAIDSIPQHGNQFDEVLLEESVQKANLRQYPGSLGRQLQFNNRSRLDLYENLPHDEMLILDTDYFLYESSLEQVWGSSVPIRINKATSDLRNPLNRHVSRIGGLSIPTYWATVLYLRRSKETDRFIKLAKYVRDNYDWFSYIYRYDPNLFRNDYVCSIAIHLLGGETGSCPSVGDLPLDNLRFAWDEDRVVGFTKHGLDLVSPGSPAPIRVSTNDQSIHVLNKVSLVPFLDEMIEAYRE